MIKDNKKILIIEDDRMVMDALNKKLVSESFKVIMARDGEEGLKLALSRHPDLILLDIVLPKMDGLTVLERVRKDLWGKNVPIIILSNLLRAAIDEEVEKYDITSYLVKTDWKLAEVIQRVKNELGIL